MIWYKILEGENDTRRSIELPKISIMSDLQKQIHQ